MRKTFLLGILGLLSIHAIANRYVDTSEDNWTYGSVYQWRIYTAFSDVTNAAVMKDRVYALSLNSLYSVDKLTQERSYHNRLTGLNGSLVVNMAYNPTLDALLLCYQNGQIDIIDSDGDVHNVPDLYLKQMNASKVVNHIHMNKHTAYLAMSFGIIEFDMKKQNFKGTYYLGDQSTEVTIESITTKGDSIYAISSRSLYTASLTSNLMDYASWTIQQLPSGTNAKDLCVHEGQLYMLRDSVIYVRKDFYWKVHETPFVVSKLCQTDDELYIIPQGEYGIAEMGSDSLILQEKGTFYDIKKDGSSYWFCTNPYGLHSTKLNRSFYPHGPGDRNAYRMRCYGDRLYVVPGGRWADGYKRPGNIMYLEDDLWTNIYARKLKNSDGFIPYDLMNVAQDPRDEHHYFVTSYGAGLLEMRDKELQETYTPANSPLASADPNKPHLYTRTDGAIFDDQEYLWVLNPTGTNVHVIDYAFWSTRDSKYWTSYNLFYNGEQVPLHTPGEIMIDNRNPQWKWIPLCRYNAGLILIKDNGTPAIPNDDHVTYRHTWYDQNGAQIKTNEIHALAQDLDGVLWVGTDEGLFIIPSTVDFATSDRCERIIIPRNDGTNLADYLFDNERINAIAVDGANRKWIGTENAGVFLLSADGLETIAHFTEENSPLPSNSILSITIQETTGEVFIGTNNGLMSYMSDAVPFQEDFTNIYAYPNPVHPTYKGYVVIKGLMEDTEVRILDASGNLIKILTGMGGEVVWDMTNTQGERVASGVYTILCNSLTQQKIGQTKVLIMN